MEPTVHEKAYRGIALVDTLEGTPFYIAGCGAVGSNMLDNLIRQGAKNASVIDYDRVDGHNVGTQTYGRKDQGQLKTAALKRKIFNEHGVTIKEIPRKLEPDNIESFLKVSKDNNPIFIDGFDNSEARGLIKDFCLKHGLPCVHVGLYQDYAEVVWNEEYRVPGNPKGLAVCEYPLARNIIIMAVSVASEAIMKYLATGERKSYTITLKDFKIQEMDY
jgi:molybdopterin-synthase adenylyltransferase